MCSHLCRGATRSRQEGEGRSALNRERMRAESAEVGGACRVEEPGSPCMRMRLGTQWSWKDGRMEKEACGRIRRECE